MRPRTFRSSQVVYAKAPMTRLMITPALITETHHNSCGWVTSSPPDRRRSLRYLDVVVQAGGFGARHADGARREVARDAGGELDLSGADLELELGCPFDRRAGEERLVGEEAQPLPGRGRARRRGG